MTVKVSKLVWPMVSVAVTVITLVPSRRGILPTLQEVVPLAMPEPPLSLSHVTLLRPMSSDAVPDRFIVSEVVEYVLEEEAMIAHINALEVER